MEVIIFLFCFTLHNIEEAIWAVEWKTKTMPNSRIKPNQNLFNYALLGVTILAYLASGLHLLYPDNEYFEYAFIGGVGFMLFNAVMPHLILTIVYKKLCPGVLTGCFLIIPFNIIILNNAVNSGLEIIEIFIATAIVAVILIAIFLIAVLAKKIFKINAH